MLIHMLLPNSRCGLEQDFKVILFACREPTCNIYLLG
jgi:hypothetical protein